MERILTDVEDNPVVLELKLSQKAFDMEMSFHEAENKRIVDFEENTRDYLNAKNDYIAQYMDGKL